ncbi:MAG: HD domain-containing protein [Bacteroidales bacterium]|jgi:class 3 adenylate cyclase/predicted metal-dependent HD superfamily phosphohydrolase|nr:HD domain-containing protein [Bacteroidales bacterium]
MIKKDFSTQNQLLRRISSLVSENKELKERYKTLSDSYARLASEVENLRNHEAKQENETRQVRFELVTILFAEIKGLSNIIKKSDDVAGYIDLLDRHFFQFQAILKKYGMVKVRTMGDNFVCAGGIPRKNATNPITVTLAALEMLDVMDSDRQGTWSVNIGIHTGAVTTSIEGKDQTTYGIKGDTLNVVSRIASIGEKNVVTLSATTYELVKELFDCTYTGCLPVKYRQKLELYGVEGIQQEYSSDKKCRFSNEAFRTRLLLIQFGDLQEHILDLLENKLPKNRFYHNVKHTVDVVTESELIGWAEGLDDHQLLLLKTAALFHDTGHIIAYADHEERSTEIARETLPSYGYSPAEIDEICRIIMATKLPPKPADLLESIICDSDLDYLGRADFIPVSNALYEELKAQNKMTSLNEWNKMQLKFISSHQYFTKTGRNLREVKKQEQIDRIKRLIAD